MSDIPISRRSPDVTDEIMLAKVIDLSARLARATLFVRSVAETPVDPLASNELRAEAALILRYLEGQ